MLASVAQSRQVEVEIDGLAGPLPSMLDGVLPVPDDDRPTVVVQSADDDLDWPTLARMARGIALALARGWLLTDFRAVFATLANMQSPIGGGLECPDDETLARAFSQPVERIKEVLRSFRASNLRILDWLVPIVAVRFGHEAATFLLDHEHALVEDAEIVAALARTGVDGEAARSLVNACHAAEGLNELRQDLGISLAAFNATTAALGAPFPQLRFEGP